MKSIKKEHFNMDEFNHNVKDEDSKMSNLMTNNEDTLDQENNNFQKDIDSSDKEVSMEA